jgi:hypothetical protein
MAWNTDACAAREASRDAADSSNNAGTADSEEQVRKVGGKQQAAKSNVAS